MVDSIQGGHLEVRSPQVAIKSKNLRSLKTLVETKRRQLAYLMQSADWAVLPPHEKIFAETIYDDILDLQEDIDTKVLRLSTRYAKLESKLRKAVESGEIRPQNGGIKGIICPAAHEDDDE